MTKFTFLLILCIVALTSAFHITHSIRTPMKAINNDNTFHQDNRLMMVSHRMGFNRLSRPADQRKALLRALTTEVIRHGKLSSILIIAQAFIVPNKYYKKFSNIYIYV